MKKISTYLASALLMMVVFTSCSSSSDDNKDAKQEDGKDAKQENSNASEPKEIDVAQLEEPCDYVDAMEVILDEMIKLIESVDGDLSKLTEDDLKHGQALSVKLEELKDASVEKFDDDFFDDCPNAKAVEEKFRKYNR